MMITSDKITYIDEYCYFYFSAAPMKYLFPFLSTFGSSTYEFLETVCLFIIFFLFSARLLVFLRVGQLLFKR